MRWRSSSGNRCSAARRSACTKPGREKTSRKTLKALVASVQGDKNIRTHLGAELTQVEGFVGNFKSTFEAGSTKGTLEHGIAVLATGCYEHQA
jgi:heterodisulfide reductase subunit A-like polyferredoxin